MSNENIMSYDENIDNWSELKCYMAINECGGFIWQMNRDISHGRIPDKDHVAIDADIEKVRKFQFRVVSVIPKFGVVLNHDLTPTENYWKWFRWWNSYIKDLSDSENEELLTLLNNKKDHSKFRPVGSWK